jgi:hypothetical protein
MSQLCLHECLRGPASIDPAKRKTVCFTKARATEPVNYSLRDTVIPETISCKYLAIIVSSDSNWDDQVN